MHDVEISTVILAWGSVPERNGIVAGASSLLMALVGHTQKAQESGLRNIRKFLEKQYRDEMDVGHIYNALTFSLLIGHFNKTFPQF